MRFNTANLTIGDYYYKESLTVEHKEFTLNKSRYELTKLKTMKFLKTLKWTKEIDELIEKNIMMYLSIYLPKYLTAYGNSNLNGELNLGVNDWGILTGIPMRKLIKKQTMLDYIRSILSEQICKYENQKLLSKCEIDNLMKQIDIQIIKLNTNTKDIEDMEDIQLEKKIVTFFKQKEMIQQKMDYIRKREDVWKEKYENYRTLVNIMKNLYTSKQLYNYIRDNLSNRESQKVLRNYWSICKQFTLPDHNKMQIDKRNPKKLLYWLVTFKDYMIEKLSKQKPNFSELKKKVNKFINNTEKINPIKLFYQLTPIQKQLIETEIPYYIIKITINGENIPELMFKISKSYSSDNNVWKYKNRVNTKFGPCCI